MAVDVRIVEMSLARRKIRCDLNTMRVHLGNKVNAQCFRHNVGVARHGGLSDQCEPIPHMVLGKLAH
ncbi:hypothetical protein Ancab_001916 [Ancistrocladus abbreviatus]